VAQPFGCSSMQGGIPGRPKKLYRKKIKLAPKKVNFLRNWFMGDFLEFILWSSLDNSKDNSYWMVILGNFHMLS
jgi:hypothetical protein